jgi:hypothetical protein
MAILVIWSLLLGAILGRFFKVLVLVPACALVVATVLVRCPFLEFVVLIIGLQIGYVSGFLSLPRASHAKLTVDI